MAAMNSAVRTKLLLENYLEARLSGSLSGYDIRQVNPDNFEHYYILIQPKTGIYKGHMYILELKTKYGHGADATTYPINPPYAHFVTDVFHTNISSNGGSICVDILKQREKWVPTYSFDAIVQNILMLFDEPNNNSPYNSEASKLYVSCEKNFKERKKGKKLTFAEEEKLYDECFTGFKLTATQFARKNRLEQYTKWFPQLIDDPVQRESALKKDKEELDTLQEMLTKLKAKKKPVKPAETTSEEEKTKPGFDKPAETASEEEPKPGVDKPDSQSKPKSKPKPEAKPNRWAKYQQK
jgi:peroxin-4